VLLVRVWRKCDTQHTSTNTLSLSEAAQLKVHNGQSRSEQQRQERRKIDTNKGRRRGEARKGRLHCC